jgi:hypothetical protein
MKEGSKGGGGGSGDGGDGGGGSGCGAQGRGYGGGVWLKSCIEQSFILPTNKTLKILSFLAPVTPMHEHNNRYKLRRDKGILQEIPIFKDNSFK